MTQATTVDTHEEQRDALIGRLFEAAIGTLDVFSIYIGDRLGLYRMLDALGSATSGELAVVSGTNERYAREWLEQQAATGLLGVENPEAGATERRFWLPAGHREVLVEQDSLNHLAPLLRLAVGVTRPLPAILEAYRRGGGIPYAHYGADTIEGIAHMNRPMFLNLMGTEWLPAVTDIHQRLLADPPARVADVGCGTGWSSIAIARAYPNVSVHGFDLDEGSIETARDNVAEAGLEGRVTFAIGDAAELAADGEYDLVTLFETLHDMARPVEALRQLRRLAGARGAIIIADERVGETFTAPGDDVERLNYGFSVLHCLPAALADSPSAGTGTVMRPQTLRDYAEEAGFNMVEVLPIENDFWRFYRLRP